MAGGADDVHWPLLLMSPLGAPLDAELAGRLGAACAAGAAPAAAVRRAFADEVLSGVHAALRAAHGTRLVHCDVRPANCVIAGGAPLLLDWGAPGPLEQGFGLTDYIAGRLERALGAAVAAGGGPPVVLGYCMGGLLALALTQRRPAEVAGLALLATPWDFHAAGSARPQALAALLPALAPVLAAGSLPVDALQALFALLDPFAVIRKYQAFAGLDPASAAARRFVALEDWLNDGVPLAAPVARECLAGWYGANAPARGAWHVAGAPVRPGAITCPVFLAIPARDRIVAPASARALAAALPAARVHEAAAGHIGMVAGGGAEAALWRPLAGWLASLALLPRGAAGDTAPRRPRVRTADRPAPRQQRGTQT
jgi:polyhydroxyalkanoate synthase